MEPILILLNSDCKQLHNSLDELAASAANVNVYLLPNENLKTFSLPHAEGYVVISDTLEVCSMLRQKVIVKNDNSFFIQISNATDGLCEHADLCVEPAINIVELAVRCALKQVRLQNKLFAFNNCYAAKEGGITESSEAQLVTQQKRFMMMVNHELRTPATILSSSLEILRMNASKLGETESRFLDNAIEGSRRLNALLQNLLLALPVKPTFQTTNDIIPLRSVLTNLQRDHQALLISRKISLSIDCPDSLHAQGDAASIRKLFEELLSNALKYTPSGGSISLEARLFNGKICVDVRDSGIGIHKSLIGNVFRAFYQQNNSMQHHSSKTAFLGAGRGLGLTVCRNIVTAHG